ncbi:hypothetical protein QCA50_015447 [Cerrena zonata]|uniref:Cytochrome P450 n=1 Tax=Cerrena zonata TaxID=2478898 RepID=A0AAW0FKU9_9APHY
MGHRVRYSSINCDDNHISLRSGNYFTLGKSMVSVHTPAHRRQRKMINVVFSIKHMRSVTPLFYGVAHKLRVGLAADVGATPTTVDILKWFGRTALELIGQGGLGYSRDPLDRPGRTEYGDVLKQFLPLLFLNGHWIQSVLKYVKYIGTPSFRAAAIDWLPIPELRELKKVVMEMDKEAMKIYEMKKHNLDGEETMIKQVGEGKYIMSHMLRANKVAPDEERLEEAEIIGQMSLLVLAGVDTTSNGMTQLMLLLSEYPEIQDKMRAEIRQAQVQHGEDIPYDILVALPYMDAVCRESMRLYPPAAFVYREAQNDTIVPLSEPITGTDGTTVKEIPVPAGTTLVAGISAINCSKEIWGEDVLEFKPERWLSPLPSTVNDAHIPGVYSNLMTFTGGRRSCIGFKFAQLEMKVLLTTVLSSFKVSLADESKDVVWNLASVRYPTIGKDSTLPACPITVERIRD